jgi:hypothetical protein
MGPELWIALVAVFVSGGAIGSVGTLMAQWILKKVDAPPSARQRLEGAEVDVLRAEVADMGRHMRNLDARLDFTERLLDGALPLAPPPPRIDDSIPSPGGRGEED